MFDFKNVYDFDSHINNSIPDYTTLLELVATFVVENAHPSGEVIDIGCSTGTLLNNCIKRPDVTYTGVDPVEFKGTKEFNFVKGDALEYLSKCESADVVVSMFTLQFLGRHKRTSVLEEVRRLVQEGGVFIVAEKCFFPPNVENVLKRGHIHKKRNAFSDAEILDKEMQLMGSMFCLSDSALVSELSGVGTCVPIWQSYNFRCFVVTA